MMKIYDDNFSWQGWGGQLQLASGECRLRIYDLQKGMDDGTRHLRPIIVIISELPTKKKMYGTVSIRSCCSHIATLVTEKFNIDPNRMMFIEYYPAVVYGEKRQHQIPERYDVVDFVWKKNKALHPKWRELTPPILDTVKELVENSEES